MRKPYFKRHKDDEWFDEIVLMNEGAPSLRAVIVPRYKTSYMSGDEWRVSASWQFQRGKVWSDFDTGKLNIEIACIALYPGLFGSHKEWHGGETLGIVFFRKGIEIYKSTYDGKALPLLHAAGHLPWARIHASENSVPRVDMNVYCFQPGCAKKAVSTYRLKKEFCREGHEEEPHKETLRRFCHRHLRRGDCGLEDSDINYEVVDGPGPDGAREREEDESPAAFGGVIDMRRDVE